MACGLPVTGDGQSCLPLCVELGLKLLACLPHTILPKTKLLQGENQPRSILVPSLTTSVP